MAVPVFDAPLLQSFHTVVTVELTQTNVTVGEGDGGVEVCVSVDMPTARPYPLYIQALETTPTSAEGTCKYIFSL